MDMDMEYTANWKMVIKPGSIEVLTLPMALKTTNNDGLDKNRFCHSSSLTIHTK